MGTEWEEQPADSIRSITALKKPRNLCVSERVKVPSVELLAKHGSLGFGFGLEAVEKFILKRIKKPRLTKEELWSESNHSFPDSLK